jgi:hypothetical protein
LESSSRAFSDGTIGFSIHPFTGKMHFFFCPYHSGSEKYFNLEEPEIPSFSLAGEFLKLTVKYS